MKKKGNKKMPTPRHKLCSEFSLFVVNALEKKHLHIELAT